MNEFQYKKELKKEMYRESQKIGLSKIEVDALFVISKQVLKALNMKSDELNRIPWHEKTSIVFNGERLTILHIYYAVFEHFRIPYTDENVPYGEEFERNPTVAHLFVDIKEKIALYKKQKP